MRANRSVGYKTVRTCKLCDLLYLLRNEGICLCPLPYSVRADISSE